MTRSAWFGAVFFVGCGSSNATAPEQPAPTTTPLGDVALTGAPEPAAPRTLGVGSSHACAVVAGGVRCWGSNSQGQLGDGTTTTPKKSVVVPGLADIVEVAVGDVHTCARSAAGSVWCWGGNASGELGYETTDMCGPTPCSRQPRPVAALTSTLRVAAGNGRTCGLKNDGGVRCFGFSTQWDAPLSNNQDVAIDSSSGVCVIAAPARVVRCWSGGALGAERMVAKKGGGGPQPGFVRLSLGSEKAGVLDDGSVVAWDGARMPALGKALDLGTAPLFGCALLEGGGPVCWGNNSLGTLGRAGPSSDTPVSVNKLVSMGELAVGRDASCARTADEVWCWGSNGSGVVSPGGSMTSTGPGRVTL